MKDFKKLVHKTEFKVGVGIGLVSIAFIAGAYLGIDIEAKVLKKWLEEGKLIVNKDFLNNMKSKAVAEGINKNAACVIDFINDPNDILISADDSFYKQFGKHLEEVVKKG